MDFAAAVRAGFKNYVNFRGIAKRPEYWYWILFTFLVSIVASVIDASGSIQTAFSIATVLPTLGVTVRRLRDAGFSWLWLLLPVPGLFPFTFGLIGIFSELERLGIDISIFESPDAADEAIIMELGNNSAFVESAGLVVLSALFIFVTSLIVNVIFPIQRSKSFAQGNKRVAPQGPETPEL